jgi:hypothetical protein
MPNEGHTVWPKTPTRHLGVKTTGTRYRISEFASGGLVLIQTGSFFSVLSQHSPLLHCWKANWGLELRTLESEQTSSQLWSMALNWHAALQSWLHSTSVLLLLARRRGTATIAEVQNCELGEILCCVYCTPLSYTRTGNSFIQLRVRVTYLCGQCCGASWTLKQKQIATTKTSTCARKNSSTLPWTSLFDHYRAGRIDQSHCHSASWIAIVLIWNTLKWNQEKRQQGQY